MTGSPFPRLSPREVLAVLDQMVLEAEEAQQMAGWTCICGAMTYGIWQPGAVCSGCTYDGHDRSHIDQYLLVPVPEEKALDGAT